MIIKGSYKRRVTPSKTPKKMNIAVVKKNGETDIVECDRVKALKAFNAR